jgi:hypothetical protein
MGAAVGFGGSVWAQRRVKRTVERYLPDRMGADVAQRARYLADDVRDAIDEGREAMRAREEELRRQLGVVGPGLPDDRIGRRGSPAAEPGRLRPRRRPRPVPIIDVTERHLEDRAAPSPLRRGPRRQQSGE